MHKKMLTREFLGLVCILGMTAVICVNAIPASSCLYQNWVIASGYTYAIPVNGRCMKYTCLSGTLSEAEYACFFDNRCFLEGQTYQKACEQYKCFTSGSSPSVKYTMTSVESNC